MRNVALILASGTGARSGLNQPKQFFEVGGRTLLEHSIAAFDTHPLIDEIIVVSHPDFIERTQSITNGFKKVSAVIAGGETRQESSYNGVFSVQNADNVLIHDAVRAFITHEIISACIEGLNEHDAVCTATETADTILEVNENGKIIAVPQRKFLRCAQTPQCFKLDLIKHAHELARVQKQSVTDDCGLILANELAEIYIVNGASGNRKITYPEDLDFAEWIYKKRLDF